jgi:metal-responsive CopG/Arc/MetJ family transcriptional regulator
MFDENFLGILNKKIPVSITIDKVLYDEIIEYKEKNNINSLSPLINEILKKWIKKVKKK